MFVHKKRLLAIYLIFFIAFSLLLGRLFQIQFVKGHLYSQLAVAQRQKTVNFIQYPRGTILDRNLRPLTNIKQQPCVVVFPVMVKDFSSTAKLLAKFLGIPEKTVITKLEAGRNDPKIVEDPFILKANASEQEIKLIEEAKLPGVFILPLIPRYQPGWPAVHILGSVGDINQEEYQKFQVEKKHYLWNDIVGKNGLEKQYEEDLKGWNSERIAVPVDNRGHYLSGLGFTKLPSVEEKVYSPHQVVLSLDEQYQSIVEKAMGGHQGAAVVMDVWNGDILAMASTPKYDPFMLKNPVTQDAYINKAIQNFPPASVFKILIAAAALEEGIVRPDDLFNCQGGITIPTGQTISCWKKDGHGEISFSQALAVSCNPVFIETGLKLGGERIIKYAKLFGLTDDRIIGYEIPQTTHIDINPSVPGDIANASIGEKGIRLSPVLVAKLVSEVANGGYSITPRLVWKVQDDKGKAIKEFSLPPSSEILSPDVANAIKSMLKLGIEEGTGLSAQIPGLEAGGKTGSSETDEVWFAGFAPVEAPRWAVVVFIQNGVSGGKAAAPVFKKIVSGLAHIEGIL